MTSAYDDLGGKRETYAEALERSNAGKAAAPLTEQERAEAEVQRREKLRRHDAHFAGDFLTIGEQVQVSRTLARQMGVLINDEDGE